MQALCIIHVIMLQRPAMTHALQHAATVFVIYTARQYYRLDGWSVVGEMCFVSAVMNGT